MLERLWMVGIDEQTPLTVRERYFCLEVPWPVSGVEEMVLLATCQRREVYLIGRKEGIQAVEQAFFPDFPREYPLLCFSGREVVYRLFRVACGMESIAVGESQVLGQVKRAWERARKEGWCGKHLNGLFLRAITLGKKVRTQIGLEKTSLSVASLAVQFAERFLGDLGGKRVFLIGTGEMGRLLLRYLLERGVGEIRASSKTPERAYALQQEFPGVRVFPYQEKYERLKGCDILVSATEAPHYTIEFSSFRMVYQGAPRLLLDLGVPRNIDPKIATLEGVKLYTLEDFQKIAEENRARRIRELAQVETMIEEGASLFWRSLEWERLFQILSRNFEKLALEELERFFQRVPSLQAEEQRQVIEAFCRANRRFLVQAKRVLFQGKTAGEEREHETKESCPNW